MINEIKGKGLFVFSDPGGAKPILSFIFNKKVKNYMVVSDRKYNFFSDFNINVETYDLNKENEIINEYNPDYIFTGTSYTSKIELKFISLAKKLNISTYSFIDHYTDGSISTQGIKYSYLKDSKFLKVFDGIAGIREFINDIKTVQKKKKPIYTDLYKIEKDVFGSAKFRIDKVPRPYFFTKYAVKQFEKQLKKFE